MNDNKIFWKLTTDSSIIVPGKYEDFKDYVAKLKKVERAIDSNTKFIDQTLDGGETYFKFNIITGEKIEDKQLSLNFEIQKAGVELKKRKSRSKRRRKS